jgi:hypothetical protein
MIARHGGNCSCIRPKTKQKEGVKGGGTVQLQDPEPKLGS